jgi:hypothetical protein
MLPQTTDKIVTPRQFQMATAPSPLSRNHGAVAGDLARGTSKVQLAKIADGSFADTH